MKIIKENKEIIKQIVFGLKAGEVFILPTDTVYGFVCDALNKEAVEKIFEIKKREKDKPLPVFVDNLEGAEKLAEINAEQKSIIKKTWPGAVTYVLKAKIDNELITKNGTIALRAPNYDFLLKVIEEFGGPLAQTSANLSGSGATNKIGEILNQFSDTNITIVDAGNLPERNPSTIIDLTDNNKIIRK